MSSMGMYQSGGTQVIDDAWEKVTDWAAMASHPATNIVNDTLVMDATANVQINWRGEFEGNVGDQFFRVVLNGTTVLGTQTETEVPGTIPTYGVSAGDTLELQGFSSFGGTVYGDVLSGEPTTYLEAIALSTDYPISPTPEIGWDIDPALDVQHHPEIGADREIGWDVEANLHAAFAYESEAQRGIEWQVTADLDVQHHYSSEADRGIDWQITADTDIQYHYSSTADRNIDWQITADTLLIQAAQPVDLSLDAAAVSLHTVSGGVVGDFPCQIIGGITWGREAEEVSICEITVMTEGDPELIEEIRPWVHRVTVWQDGAAVWTGPIQQVTIGSSITKIAARDPSTFMWRTRVPLTKTWEGERPESVADEVLRLMLDLHRLPGAPMIVPTVSPNFTYHADADIRMVNQLMDDLTKLGLHWTVVSGTFVLGQYSLEPVAELAECDFLVEIERLRDGVDTFNDVRLQGQNWAEVAVADLAGLQLQTLVSLDNLFGVGNVQQAAALYAQQSSRIRDVIKVPSGASLHPDAPVELSDLVPGKVVRVSAGGIVNLMRVDAMRVTTTPGGFDRQVTLVSIPELIPSLELGGGGPS